MDNVKNSDSDSFFLSFSNQRFSRMDSPKKIQLQKMVILDLSYLFSAKRQLSFNLFYVLSAPFALSFSICCLTGVQQRVSFPFPSSVCDSKAIRQPLKIVVKFSLIFSALKGFCYKSN